VGGTLNVSENCLDRHLSGSRRNQAALIWEGEPGDKRTLTYQQLHREVCKFANVLKRNQIKKGDRVIIYMPMCPEGAIAMSGQVTGDTTTLEDYSVLAKLSGKEE
jgi:acetyl-CoA synthetase